MDRGDAGSLGATLETAPAAVRPLPLRWCAETPEFDQAALAEALRVLATVAALEEHVRPQGEEAGGLEAEVARLNQKVQLLMEMVGGLVRAQLSLPKAVPVRLTAVGLRWQTETPPSLDSRGVIEIWLHPACPEPLRLPARVLAVSGDSPATVEAAFDELPEVFSGALEKLVFLRHRRELAESRQLRRG
jgi:hypothetical protein